MVDIQTLIWLFPIMFILHDFEEIIMVEKWLKTNSKKIYDLLPEKMADRVIQQFSMTTAQFAVAVLIIFLFVASSTIMANQYLLVCSFGKINYITIVYLVFFFLAFYTLFILFIIHFFT